MNSSSAGCDRHGLSNRLAASGHVGCLRLLLGLERRGETVKVARKANQRVSGLYTPMARSLVHHDKELKMPAGLLGKSVTPFSQSHDTTFVPAALNPLAVTGRCRMAFRREATV